MQMTDCNWEEHLLPDRQKIMLQGAGLLVSADGPLGLQLALMAAGVGASNLLRFVMRDWEAFGSLKKVSGMRGV